MQRDGITQPSSLLDHVYVVMEYDWESGEVASVWTDEDAADADAKRLNEAAGMGGATFTVLPVRLNAPGVLS